MKVVAKRIKFVISLMVCFLIGLSWSSYGQKTSSSSFLVCGDSKILLVDYTNSIDSIPKIMWSWDAHLAEDLPELYRTRLFNTMDDCKSINNGKSILVSSSSGAIGIIDMASKKMVFKAQVPNAHSVAVLPNNKIVAAASVSPHGNKVMLFDRNQPDTPLFTDSLYSAHGLVWVESAQLLFALGYDVLRAYQLGDNNTLVQKNEWKLPANGGHELSLLPDHSGLIVTEHTGSWTFHFTSLTFTKVEGVPDAENLKSLERHANGQFIFTVPEESWWTFHVNFKNPERRFAFPGMHVYKARWFGE